MTPIAVDRDTFLQHLRQSRLLAGEQVRDAVGHLGHSADGAALARALVACRLLTRFQARMLLHGRSDGFFLGPYRILEQVGHGGMGKVYKAVHQTMNRTVALKVLAPNLVKTEKARAFFHNEVQTAARLNHANIVHAYDANENAGRHYLAMEFIPGVTLSQLVHQRGTLPIGLACEVIRQAALGLQHAHEQGLVHRDVKPANIMLAVMRNPSGAAPSAAGGSELTRRAAGLALQVKLLDFGLARLHRRPRQRPGADAEGGRHPITGTPDFMSPEQARDRDAVDIRSDLYSLGCTLYYLVTGRAPFAGGTMLEKLIRHHSEVPAPPESLRPRLPAAVATIVLRLLAKDPLDRFQTPQALADALAPYASIRGLSHARKRRRRPAAAAAGKTLRQDQDDTAPHAGVPTMMSAEQEALSSWVEIRLGQRRRTRRTFAWGAAAFAALAATALTATLLWMRAG